MKTTFSSQFFIFFYALISIAFVANGQTSSQDRPVGSFTGIDVGSAFEVILTQGNDHKVVVDVEDKLHEKIDLEVRNNTLYVKTNGKINTKKKMSVYITFEQVDKLNFSGASKVSATTPIKGNDMKINLSGASKLDLNLFVADLEFNGSGASKTTLTGNCNNLKLDLSGASKFSAFDLPAKTASLDLSGASKVDVTVADRIDVNSSGSSKVNYKGGATMGQLKTSGASSITKI
jgi:hypothetical protein